MFFSGWLSIWCCLVLYAEARPTPGLLKPSEDSFYSAPANISSYKPGDIIASRKIISPQTPFASLAVQSAWQVLYRSTDPFGEANAVVGTILQPANADPKKVLNYLAIEDASQLDCSPSYAFLNRPGADNIQNKIELVLIDAALKEGWYVISPDYEGLQSAFTVGKQAGYATLDSIRAGVNFKEAGIDKDAKVITWGYSGGSIPALWSSVLHPSYAPGLNLIGSAIGGAVQNITSVAEAVEGSQSVGITALAIKGLMNQYADMEKYVYENISPSNAKRFNVTERTCLVDAAFHFQDVKFFTGDDPVFQMGYEILEAGPVKSSIQANMLSLENVTVPEIPLFMYSGKRDTTAPLDKNADLIFDTWKQRNISSLEYAVDRIANHRSEFTAGAPAAFEWIKNRLNDHGSPVDGAVKTQRLSNLAYPGISQSLVNALENAIGNSIIYAPNGASKQELSEANSEFTQAKLAAKESKNT